MLWLKHFNDIPKVPHAEVPDAIMVSCVGDPDVFSLREHLKEKGMNKPVLDQCVSFGRGVINA